MVHHTSPTTSTPILISVKQGNTIDFNIEVRSRTLYGFSKYAVFDNFGFMIEVALAFCILGVVDVSLVAGQFGTLISKGVDVENFDFAGEWKERIEVEKDWLHPLDGQQVESKR